MAPLKNLCNFWRTLKTALINCEISLILTYPKNCFLVAGTATNQMKLYVPVVILSTQCNGKLLKQLELGFKRIINWNKYQSKITDQTQNGY